MFTKTTATRRRRFLLMSSFLVVCSRAKSISSCTTFCSGLATTRRSSLSSSTTRRRSFFLATNNNNNNSNSNNNNEDLQQLQEQITSLNHGIPLNPSSPKQVSRAIFGAPQSATKSILQQAATSIELSPHQRHMAQLILQYRGVLQQQPKQQRMASTSTITSSTAVVADSQEPEQSTTQSSSPPPPSNHQPPVIVSHEQVVESLFGPKSQMHEYWKEPLKRLSRSTARTLLTQLDPQHCPMGYNPNSQRKSTATATVAVAVAKRGTFVHFCQTQKKIYPECVILVRCGDFYETYGLDAVMLVEHVGLNPMAGKCKAGCPYRNIQSTVDALTQQGLSVAVYEEVGSVSSSSSQKLKTRLLTQIVSPACPTYLYDTNWLLGNNGGSSILEGLPPSRPCVGIVHTAAGYHFVEVSLEAQSIQYSERLTPEAVACRLAAYPPADPLLYIPTVTEYDEQNESNNIYNLPFLPQRSTYQTNEDRGGYRLQPKILSPHLVRDATSDADRYIPTIVETLLQLNERRQGQEEEAEASSSTSSSSSYHPQRPTTMDDFTITTTTTSSSSSSQNSVTTTNPLYVETATQLGLLKDPTIPSLIANVLDDAAPALARRFLQRYLLVPPPPHVAQAMAQVVDSLMNDNHNVALPPLTVPPIGKVLSLIRVGQASASIYGDLCKSLSTTLWLLQPQQQKQDLLPVDALLVLCQHESGLPAERDSLLKRCEEAMEAMEAVISSVHHADALYDDDHDDDAVMEDLYVPLTFLERNESPWRGRVQPHVAQAAYERVRQAANALCQAVAEDFIVEDSSNNNKSLIVQDIFNNLLALKQVPKRGDASTIADDYYFHPRDRHGKRLGNRYTTVKVQQALSDYVSACDLACEEVSSILSNLARTLQEEGHIPAIVQSAHLNLVLSVAFHHAVKAKKNRWHLADTMEPSDDNDNGNEQMTTTVPRLVNLWPYWMDRSQAVANTFDLNGLFLLTAPNMSGKSTLMRSTAAAALLTVCGLCAPLEAGSRIPRFDTLFLRGASADVPSEDKSAFGAEMGDIAALMRCCGSQSLIFVDELGRGTSPRDGTRLAGAVLEAMAKREMSGIFATHLHDILELPLERKDRIVTKRMAIDQQTTTTQEEDDHDIDSYEWTYRLEDGVCTDSLALVTAARFGLPEEIIRRAEELAAYLPERVSSSTRNHYLEDDGSQGLNDEQSSSEEELETILPSSTTPSRPPKKKGRNNRQDCEESFQKAVALVEDVLGQSAIIIPPRWSPPASLGIKSCVYVLELAHCDDGPPRYYVGETDSLSQRLRQHRKKGLPWAQSRAVALPVNSKTQARAWESLLIQKLAQSGFSMESVADGRSLRPQF